jgi:deazaflavin-dependent oxidoreductase (nitroreductase family)
MSTREEKRAAFLDRVRFFNKHFFNRLTLALTRWGYGPFILLQHRGRRSGRVYQTPVLATPVGDRIIIPLSYGEHVDWLQNVLAAGECKLIRNKLQSTGKTPQVISADEAATELPDKRRRLFQLFKVEKYLRLEVT